MREKSCCDVDSAISTKLAVLIVCIVNLCVLNAFRQILNGGVEEKKKQYKNFLSSSSLSLDIHQFAQATAQKWKLSASDSVALLERVAASNLNVSSTGYLVPEQDIMVFFHPFFKTSGASFSGLLRDTIGGVLPGSNSIDYFKTDEFQSQIQVDLGGSISNVDYVRMWWRSKRVVYSQSRFRDYQQPCKEFSVCNTLTSTYPHDQRFRMITILKDPVELRASQFFDWMCMTKKWFGASTLYVDELNLPRNNSTDTCHGLTMEHLTQIRYKFYEQYCQTKSGELGMDGCASYVKDKVDPKPHCTSVAALLNSPKYWLYLHDMFQYGTVQRKDTTSVADFEQGALQYFGGLDRVDNIALDWFGIADRMEESMCLFHYQFRIPHATATTKTSWTRDKKCRPSNYWSDADKELVRQREDLDYAVFRAANAILDVRLAKMHQEMKELQIRNETLETMPYVSPNCFDMIVNNLQL